MIFYKTKLGRSFNCTVEDFIKSEDYKNLENKVDLIFTSPPFPLNRKKAYGNRQDDDYRQWLREIFNSLKFLLRDTGSIVVEIGNAWNKGEPTMSTLPLKTLLDIQEFCDLKLCQTFVWNNKAKLPSPAQWVTVERIRVKDSYTNIWWYSKTSFPKASNKNVLVPYSESMKKLLKTKKYNAGKRPSEHHIGESSFFNDNGGAIPSSFLDSGIGVMIGEPSAVYETYQEQVNILEGANTASNTSYRNYCKENGLNLHPALMPEYIPEFFIKFLTDPGDLVLDPFAGSNTTGSVAEKLGREWLAVEADNNYLEGSKGRFESEFVLSK